MTRPQFHEDWFDPTAKRPYGVTPSEVRTAIEAFYDLCGDLSKFLLDEDHGRLETTYSESSGEWRADNSEESWLVVCRCEWGDSEADIQDPDPVRLAQALTAFLTEKDWSDPIDENPDAIDERGGKPLENGQRHAQFDSTHAEGNPVCVTEQATFGGHR